MGGAGGGHPLAPAADTAQCAEWCAQMRGQRSSLVNNSCSWVSCAELACRERPWSEKAIISFTTIPGRLNETSGVVASFFAQTMQPCAVVAHLPTSYARADVGKLTASGLPPWFSRIHVNWVSKDDLSLGCRGLPWAAAR